MCLCMLGYGDLLCPKVRFRASAASSHACVKSLWAEVVLFLVTFMLTVNSGLMSLWILLFCFLLLLDAIMQALFPFTLCDCSVLIKEQQ